jgi:hypothetical protein
MRRLASLLLHGGPAREGGGAVGFARLNWQLRVASGRISFVFGLFLIYDPGFAQGRTVHGKPVLRAPLNINAHKSCPQFRAVDFFVKRRLAT